MTDTKVPYPTNKHFTDQKSTIIVSQIPYIVISSLYCIFFAILAATLPIFLILSKNENLLGSNVVDGLLWIASIVNLLSAAKRFYAIENMCAALHATVPHNIDDDFKANKQAREDSQKN